MGHARALLGITDADALRRLAHRAIREGLSVRATEALVRALGRRERKRPASPDGAGVRDLVSRLQRRLGARCRVVQKTPSAGRLEVEYTSLEELDGILAKIGV
jgi:ParB family chromosome partitioning protein